MLTQYIEKVINRQDLIAAEAQAAMHIIMTGGATPAQIGGYLVALRMKGETVAEITGSAAAMRSVVNPVVVSVNGSGLIDTAGTGGDGSHSFNISTAAAFIIAGAGRKVAKHGNRAASSRSGSADVLEALGVSLELMPEQVGQCIEEVGIGFMFAPKFHPAMRHAIGPRRELAQRTIFNLLGPLTNPANATHQLIGVFNPDLTHPIAEVLGKLGSRAAMVVHGDGGLDELTTTGLSRMSHLKDGQVRTMQLNAAEFGLRPASREDLAGGDAHENAGIMGRLLSGEITTPLKDVVLFNAGAALAMDDGDIERGLEAARVALESGAALAKMNGLVETSQRLAGQR